MQFGYRKFLTSIHAAFDPLTRLFIDLSVRSFTGHLQFDHVKSTLNLSVMTADQAQAQGTQRAKEARSLSGGEKSYTQVCLLLALWESVGCPIRCLDEFDVFLDA